MIGSESLRVNHLRLDPVNCSDYPMSGSFYNCAFPKKRIGIVAVILLSMLPFNSSESAQPQAPVGIGSAGVTGEPPALRFAVRRGFRIVKRFPAVSGLVGWVLQGTDGQYTVLFSTPDGKTTINGDLMTTSGENLTQRYIAQYVPKPNLDGLWTKFGKSSVVVAGAQNKPKSTIYVIMDPNCIFCHMLWIALKPYEAAGLQVRWIPVGFLHEDSMGKAAALLSGGEPLFTQLQERFDEKAESGGISAVKVTPELKSRLDANLALMHEAQVQGTPGIFYRDAAGHVRREDGMPKLSQLSSITGIPSQPEPDPRLARFSK